MPYLPLLGAFINWYLLAQLQVSALLMLLLYFLIAVIGYFSYGFRHSYGNTQGWGYNRKEGILVTHDGDKAGVENENTFLQRVISLPQVGVREIT
jgi:Ca2+/Na+ antiporter